MEQTGILFNIQHFTIHDGPGIRTELFLKGCPLNCRWCSNPESLKKKIQPGVYRKKCIGAKSCGLCEKVCPVGRCAETDPEEAREKATVNLSGHVDSPLVFYRNRLKGIDYGRCSGCMKCAETCPADAIKAWGMKMTVDEVMPEIRRDKGYYDRSGGGVTVSGGEPLMQVDFTAGVFRECRREGIQTCCESCLHADWKELEKLLPLTDIWITDLKVMDDDLHRKETGAGNGLILENLKKLSRVADIRLILRIPVIPGVNDNDDNMRKSADFIINEMDGNIRTLQLLSFMRLGEEKYESLGMNYGMKGVSFRRDHFQKKINGFAEYFNSRGIHTVVGTREKEEPEAGSR